MVDDCDDYLVEHFRSPRDDVDVPASYRVVGAGADCD
uniref:Unannotated protein n=1 Tax=freshwater metagenome TaxID=449393 RepID=A0A6J5ZT22_9ZZZZ